MATRLQKLEPISQPTKTSPRIVLTSHHDNSIWLFPKYICSTLNTSGFLSLPDWAAFFWWQRSTSNDFSSSDSGFLPQKNVWNSGLHEPLKFTTWLNIKAWAAYERLTWPSQNEIKTFNFFGGKSPWFNWFWICPFVILKILVLLSVWCIFLWQNMYFIPLLSQRFHMVLAMFSSLQIRCTSWQERGQREGLFKTGNYCTWHIAYYWEFVSLFPLTGY